MGKILRHLKDNWWEKVEGNFWWHVLTELKRYFWGRGGVSTVLVYLTGIATSAYHALQARADSWPSYLLVFACVVVGLNGILALWSRWRGHPAVQPQNIAKKGRAIPTPDAQRALVNTLASYHNDLTKVKIAFLAPFHHPLASTLAAVFNLAKWQTSFNDTAQEVILKRYISGIQVSGFNKVLVEAVANALKNAGLSDAKAIVEETQIEQGTAKWHTIQHYIRIFIGYHE